MSTTEHNHSKWITYAPDCPACKERDREQRREQAAVYVAATLKTKQAIDAALERERKRQAIEDAADIRRMRLDRDAKRKRNSRRGKRGLEAAQWGEGRRRARRTPGFVADVVQMCSNAESEVSE